MELYDANSQPETVASNVRLAVVDQIAELRVVLQQVESSEEVK